MNSNNYPPPSEEVDLGQLFNAIGNFFTKLFQLIGKLFYAIFLAFVWLVFFIKKNAIVLGIALVAGLLFGWGINKLGKPLYRSTVYLLQNYPTGENLYELVEYYNALIGTGNIESLAENLGIDKEEAEKISSFQIHSILRENDKLMLYKQYQSELDSTLAASIDYSTFLENTNDYHYAFQQLDVFRYDMGNSDSIINGFVNNLNGIPYFQEIQRRDITQLEAEENAILESLAESDSLFQVYKLFLLEGKRENQGAQTNVTIENSGKEGITKELDLYLKNIELREKLIKIRREKEDHSNIVEVVASKKTISGVYQKKHLFNIQVSKPIFYMLLFFALTFIALMALEFLKFLERYKSEVA